MSLVLQATHTVAWEHWSPWKSVPTSCVCSYGSRLWNICLDCYCSFRLPLGLSSRFPFVYVLICLHRFDIHIAYITHLNNVLDRTLRKLDTKKKTCRPIRDVTITHWSPVQMIKIHVHRSTSPDRSKRSMHWLEKNDSNVTNCRFTFCCCCSYSFLSTSRKYRQ